MVDIASLVCFRVAFGALMIVDLWRYSHYQWIKAAYVAPAFHFTYYGFGWVRPWPAPGMYLHVLALALAAAGIMLGAWYRLSAALFCLGFTYVFLLEQSLYLNHFYLICLISLLLIFIPAHRALSIDAPLSVLQPVLPHEDLLGRPRAGSRSPSSAALPAPCASACAPPWPSRRSRRECTALRWRKRPAGAPPPA